MARRKSDRSVNETSRQGSIDVDGAQESVKHAKDRRYELDSTPRAVSNQGAMFALKHWMEMKPNHAKTEVRVADLFAGAGSWTLGVRKAAEALGLKPEITAVEIREDDRIHLERHADRVIIGDYSMIKDHEPYDIIIGNPAFKAWGPAIRMVIDTPCITKSGIAVALVHNGLGQRGEEGSLLFETHGPKEQWRITGPVSFRVGLNPKNGKEYGADARDYSLWVWERKCPKEWKTKNLPRLSSAEREWVVRPGTEWQREFVQTDIFGQELDR